MTITDVRVSTIAIGAGKGGVGKSTVALNLALALRAHGPIGILDFDFYGPNIAAMLGIEKVTWTTEWTLARRGHQIRFHPIERDGLHVVSMGFVLGDDQPLGMDPSTVALVARQFAQGTVWPDLRYLVVDLPPGTSAVQHILVREFHPDAAIIVVTPDGLAHLDGRKAVQMFRLMRVPVLGAVENMAATKCPHCGGPIALFEDVHPERAIWSLGVERLATIPFDLGSAGAAEHRRGDGSSPLFESLAAQVVARTRAKDRP